MTMELIDKAAVVAWILKMKDLVSDPILSGNDLILGEKNAYFHLLDFLGTLEVKEVDLEKEFDEYIEPITTQDIKDEPFTQLFACAQHFFELGLKTKRKK